MPGGDGTGPSGLGTGTGRKKGSCINDSQLGLSNQRKGGNNGDTGFGKRSGTSRKNRKRISGKN